jgi:hypothetical protein
VANPDHLARLKEVFASAGIVVSLKGATAAKAPQASDPDSVDAVCSVRQAFFDLVPILPNTIFPISHTFIRLSSKYVCAKFLTNL